MRFFHSDLFSSFLFSFYVSMLILDIMEFGQFLWIHKVSDLIEKFIFKLEPKKTRKHLLYARLERYV